MKVLKLSTIIATNTNAKNSSGESHRTKKKTQKQTQKSFSKTISSRRAQKVSFPSQKPDSVKYYYKSL